LKCALCGLVFEESEAEAGCASCPMHAGCGKLRCPNCGYEIFPEPGWVKWLRRIGRKREAV